MPFIAVLYCRFIVYEQFRRTTKDVLCKLFPETNPFFKRGTVEAGGEEVSKNSFLRRNRGAATAHYREKGGIYYRRRAKSKKNISR